MTIGVLALQGDFKEHMTSLQSHGVLGKEVRNVSDLKEVHALIIPGGESTTIAKLLKSSGLDKAIIKRGESGMPIWGTCAGAILLAKSVKSPVPLETSLGLIDIEIERNAYGRQRDSFQTVLELPGGKEEVFFIRAPKVLKKGLTVKVLAQYKEEMVMLRQKNIIITTFHSELMHEDGVLEYFLDVNKLLP